MYGSKYCFRCARFTMIMAYDGGIDADCSDGCGRMSVELAMRLSNAHIPMIEPVRAAYQIRGFTGIKGMLSVQPAFEPIGHSERAALPAEAAKAADAEARKRVQLVFRRSMTKHMGTKEGMLEVVNYSGPTRMFLSRQLINILDQVCSLIRMARYLMTECRCRSRRRRRTGASWRRCTRCSTSS